MSGEDAGGRPLTFCFGPSPFCSQHAVRCAGSEKLSTTLVGAVPTTAPSAGTTFFRCACASATVAASDNTSAMMIRVQFIIFSLRILSAILEPDMKARDELNFVTPF